jgi:dTDP-4-dehydrorhamnose reductase
MKKILILGGSGFLGKNINEVLSSFNYEIINESRRTGCDLLLQSSIKETIQRYNPDIIINAAAHIGNISYVSKSILIYIMFNVLCEST